MMPNFLRTTFRRSKYCAFPPFPSPVLHRPECPQRCAVNRRQLIGNAAGSTVGQRQLLVSRRLVEVGSRGCRPSFVTVCAGTAVPVVPGRAQRVLTARHATAEGGVVLFQRTSRVFPAHRATDPRSLLGWKSGTAAGGCPVFAHSLALLCQTFGGMVSRARARPVLPLPCPALPVLLPCTHQCVRAYVRTCMCACMHTVLAA